MEKIIVKGGKKLSGEVKVSKAKNSVLPIIVATILSPNPIIIKDTPNLQDVTVLKELIKSLNGDITHENNGDLTINTKNLNHLNASWDLIRKMRASFLIMGPLLARFGECKISLPGGCNIGSRPINLHLKGFKNLGADIEIGHGYIEAKAKRLTGTTIYLDFPSVGATENIIMAAVFAKGTTIIDNAADEPEIRDLIRFLNQMGAKIYNVGISKIMIEGVESLKGGIYEPIYDRIEAGTFMVAAAITKSDITINGVIEEHHRPTIEKLKECGIPISIENNKMKINASDSEILATDIKTMPYPGFPTDMQPQFMSLLSMAKGTSVITENVFENRLMHVAELVRMGANIKIEGKTAILEGVNSLTGCEVKATDLRAGAALVIAGLVAKGETVINDIYHIDRGYSDIESKFRGLGAEIYRVDR